MLIVKNWKMIQTIPRLNDHQLNLIFTRTWSEYNKKNAAAAAAVIFSIGCAHKTTITYEPKIPFVINRNHFTSSYKCVQISYSVKYLIQSVLFNSMWLATEGASKIQCLSQAITAPFHLCSMIVNIIHTYTYTYTHS